MHNNEESLITAVNKKLLIYYHVEISQKRKHIILLYFKIYKMYKSYAILTLFKL